MSSITTLLLAKTCLLSGLALWLSVVVINNLIDRQTYTFLMSGMFNMGLIKSDPNLGNGLEKRAVDSPNFVRISLNIIVVVQILNAVLLWWSALLFLLALFGAVNAADAIAWANLALTLFMLTWLLFLSGGLWFGYWIKTGAVQQVHLILTILSILALLFINVHG